MELNKQTGFDQSQSRANCAEGKAEKMCAEDPPPWKLQQKQSGETCMPGNTRRRPGDDGLSKAIYFIVSSWLR